MKQLALDIGLARAPSLASFLAGPNEAAWRHLQLWAGSPTRSPVPTYLWGAPASGKTHLLRKGVEHSLRPSRARVRAGWTPRIHEPPRVRFPGWSVDAGRRASLHAGAAARGLQLVRRLLQTTCTRACSRPPAWCLACATCKLREDLRTRLGWGHVFQLHVLSEPERRAVLRQAADARGVFLPDEVMDFILTRFSRDLGSLMQLLDHLDGYALQTKRAITIPLIKSMLENE